MYAEHGNDAGVLTKEAPENGERGDANAVRSAAPVPSFKLQPVVSSEEASERVGTSTDTPAAPRLSRDAFLPSEEVNVSRLSTTGDEQVVGEDACSTVERLRRDFAELRQEVETMRQSSLEDLPLRCRGVSLRILRDRIDAVLNESELEALRSQILKVEYALEQERQRTFQLEQQLLQLGKKEDAAMTTRSQLLQSEKQLAEWKRRNEANEKELEKLRLQNERQMVEHHTLLQHLAEANASVRQLQGKNEMLMNDRAQKIKDMQSKLDAQQREKDAALGKIAELEAHHSKLADNSVTLTHAPETPPESTAPSEEIPKQIGVLPDPPSEEHSSKEQRGEGEDELTTATPSFEQDDHQATLPQIENAHEYREQEQNLRRDAPSEDASSVEGSRWGLSISGIWGFVTGEPTR